RWFPIRAASRASKANRRYGILPHVLDAARSRRTHVTRQYAIVEAPSVLGLRPTGVERLPDALMGAGLDAQLGARRAARVEPPPYDSRRDPETLMLNAHGIAKYTRTLADAIGKILETGDFPVVLGGDCSIVLGSLLPLRPHRRHGRLQVHV